ncbi:hypothetical protein HDF16_000411 [Granulicella aggregans]|uniref:Immunity protein Imm33 domain-containing protein n=1 Tax=Granulicella aggregans TaxID=474949 RepID=A0A7W8E1S4_9BACT|nr:DUF2185 domain-containing protein [Granulicella aggregans]MBB5055742.1 hypothetical protein [Granulicella aggregans]
MAKKYFRDGSTFNDIAVGFGSCIASDRITADGALVGFMYREQPDDQYDSGWRFLAGDESDDYANTPKNLGLYDVNTIANYDSAIIEHLDAPFGTAFVREGSILIVDHTSVIPRHDTQPDARVPHP